MALAAGEYKSGGRVFDEDGREVVAVVGDVGVTTFEELTDVDWTTFADGDIPAYNAVSGKFEGRTPPGEDVHRVTSTAIFTVNETADDVGFANRDGLGAPFNAFDFTMPAEPVVVEFYCPNVSNATADKQTSCSIENQAGTVNYAQSSVSSPAANLGGPMMLRVLLTSAEFAAGAAVSLRVMGWASTGAGQGTISGAAGKIIMRAYAV